MVADLPPHTAEAQKDYDPLTLPQVVPVQLQNRQSALKVQVEFLKDKTTKLFILLLNMPLLGKL